MSQFGAGIIFLVIEFAANNFDFPSTSYFNSRRRDVYMQRGLVCITLESESNLSGLSERHWQ